MSERNPPGALLDGEPDEYGYVWQGNTGPAQPFVYHFHGVPWHEAPKPRKLHLCFPQTYGFFGILDPRVDRCACGGVRVGRQLRFREKNSRR